VLPVLLLFATVQASPQPTAAPARAQTLSDYATGLRGRTPSPGSVTTFHSTLPTPQPINTPAAPQQIAPPNCTPPDNLDALKKSGRYRDPVEVQHDFPTYPERYRRAYLHGQVILEGTVCTDGTVQNSRVLRGVDPRLDQLALEAFRAWRYQPALLNDKPVAVFLSAAVNFKLEPPKRR